MLHSKRFFVLLTIIGALSLTKYTLAASMIVIPAPALSSIPTIVELNSEINVQTVLIPMTPELRDYLKQRVLFINSIKTPFRGNLSALKLEFSVTNTGNVPIGLEDFLSVANDSITNESENRRKIPSFIDNVDGEVSDKDNSYSQIITFKALQNFKNWETATAIPITFKISPTWRPRCPTGVDYRVAISMSNIRLTT